MFLVSTLLLLNVIERELSLPVLFEKWTSWACMFGSRLIFSIEYHMISVWIEASHATPY